MKQSIRSFAASAGTGLGMENMEDITAYYNSGITDAKAGNTVNRPPETIEYVERRAAYDHAQADYQKTLQPIYWQGYEDAANKTTLRQPKDSAALIMYNKGRADRAKSGGTIVVVPADKKAGTVSGGAPMTGITTAKPVTPPPPQAPQTAGFSMPLVLGIGAAAVGLFFYFRKKG